MDGDDRNIELLLRFFRQYIKEFAGHIKQEEEYVFPYILYLDECLTKGLVEQKYVGNLDVFTIDAYHQDHNNIEEKLFDLKNILLKYLPPPVDDYKYTNLLFDLVITSYSIHYTKLYDNNVFW